MGMERHVAQRDMEGQRIDRQLAVLDLDAESDALERQAARRP